MDFLIITKIIFVFQYITCGITISSDDLRRLVPDKLLYHFNKSIVVSPLSLRLAMFKLASVAQGDVKQELLSALGYQKDYMLNSSYWNLQEPLTELKNIDFVMFNRLFVNYSNDFNDQLLSPAYGVQVEKVSFNYPDASTAYINKMIDRMSYKRLTDVLQRNDIDKESSMLIINAYYIKVTCEVPFDLKLTKPMKFRQFTGDVVMVPMMHKTEDVLYVDDDLNKIKVINMKLASFGASMTIVIPEDSRSLLDFLKNSLRPNYFRTIKYRMRLESVNVAIPRFKLKTLVDWTNSLKMTGLKKVFDKNNTGLDSILKDTIKSKHVYLNKVKQKNFIEMNEMGAFRMIHKNDMSRDFQRLTPSARLEALADRPFYFAISLQYDRSNYWNAEDLFTGVYYGPEK